MHLGLPALLLKPSIIHAFLTESSESNAQKWASRTAGLLLGTGTWSAVAAQLFVPAADAVPTLLCKMQSHHVKTISAFCLHCFFGLQILPSLHICGIYQLLLENFNELKKCQPISLQKHTVKPIFHTASYAVRNKTEWQWAASILF